MLSLRRGVACGLLAAAFLLSPADLVAQDIPVSGLTQQADSVALPSELAPPAPIPLESVPVRLEQDVERLRKIQRDMARTAGYSDTQLDLDDILVGVTAILDNFDRVALQDLHSSDIDNFRNSIEREQHRLSARSQSLQKRFRELEADQQYLKRIEIEWVLYQASPPG